MALAAWPAAALRAEDNLLDIHRSPYTGLATFARPCGSAVIPIRSSSREHLSRASAFLLEYEHIFGIADPNSQLRFEVSETDHLGHHHITFSQVHRGLPVFATALKIHQDAVGNILSANGHVFPIPDDLNIVPDLSADTAIGLAGTQFKSNAPDVERSDLVVVDPGWYGDPPAGARLAYWLVLSDPTSETREAFFIDAHTGKTLDRWSLTHTARERRVFDDVTNVFLRVEGGPPSGDPDADAAYDYSGDFYDFFFRGFGRDGINNRGLSLNSTVNFVSPRCPNAFGGASGTAYCTGVATDDIVAHEFGHGLMEFTANLIYQNQSGQLNESYSDVWGEVVDLLNGNANTPGLSGGTPWPAHASGPGTDWPNSVRTTCVYDAWASLRSPAPLASDFSAETALFGPRLSATGVSGRAVIVNPPQACNADLPFSNDAAIAGSIAIVARGNCTFVEKVLNVQKAGAVGVIVVNNDPFGAVRPGGSHPNISIPTVMVAKADGERLKVAALLTAVTVQLRDNVEPEVRWLHGEDAAAYGGANRDMWMPTCLGDPDSANHPLQTCGGNDNGGVHSGSGIPNHAFAILVDGKTFNGRTVRGIGLFKAAAVWYRALTTYLNFISDFDDAYVGLNQAADDLIGSIIKDPRDGSDYALFTEDDAAQVNEALLAVEMNTRGRCGNAQILDPSPPPICAHRSTIFADDFESGAGAWTVESIGPSGPPTPYDWILLPERLPAGRAGAAWYIADPDIGDCNAADESAVHSLLSPVVTLPADVLSPTVSFTHFVRTEAFYDGGNVRLRVDGGPWVALPESVFVLNPYNSNLAAAPAFTRNPLAGQPVWTGTTISNPLWGTSLIDLSGFVSGGQSVQMRFDFGKDGCGGVLGWFVDDFEVYDCPDCNSNGMNDLSDLADFRSADCNDNGVPDECDGFLCDDGNPCTDDGCDARQGCRHTANASACEDDDPCTTGNTCAAGNCGSRIVVRFADVAPPGGDESVELSDVFCLLDGYVQLMLCPAGDLSPCGGDGRLDDADITAVLDAYAGLPACPDPCP